jgi:hypothetical protein
LSSPNILPERGMMASELRVSLRSRAKPMAGYWREGGARNGRKLRASTRVGLRYKLNPAATSRQLSKHAPPSQVQGRSGEIFGLIT